MNTRTSFYPSSDSEDDYSPPRMGFEQQRGEERKFSRIPHFDYDDYDSDNNNDNDSEVELDYERLLEFINSLGNLRLDSNLIPFHIKQLNEVEIPTTKYEQGKGDCNSCAICQEEFKNGQELGTLKCLHKFCTPCIKKWSQMRTICPLCRCEI